MKYLIASDIHGSSFYLDKLFLAFEREKAEKLIILGDIYYHGARNPLPEFYNTQEVAAKLNKIVDKLIVIKGNCDSEVDALVSDFDFINDCVLVVKDRTFFLTHGHIYNKDFMPKTKCNGIIYGHYHTGFIEENNGIIIANCGSVSLPKNNTPRSYLTLTEDSLTLKELNGEVIKEINL